MVFFHRHICIEYYLIDHERELIANNSLIMEALLSALGIESSLSEIVKVATVVAEVAKLGKR